jgi:hypothetical protein
MNRPCRNWYISARRQKNGIRFALRHARILTDPHRLAQLKAEAEKQRSKDRLQGASLI